MIRHRVRQSAVRQPSVPQSSVPQSSVRHPGPLSTDQSKRRSPDKEKSQFFVDTGNKCLASVKSGTDQTSARVTESTKAGMLQRGELREKNHSTRDSCLDALETVDHNRQHENNLNVSGLEDAVAELDRFCRDSFQRLFSELGLQSREPNAEARRGHENRSSSYAVDSGRGDTDDTDRDDADVTDRDDADVTVREDEDVTDREDADYTDDRAEAVETGKVDAGDKGTADGDVEGQIHVDDEVSANFADDEDNDGDDSCLWFTSIGTTKESQYEPPQSNTDRVVPPTESRVSNSLNPRGSPNRSMTKSLNNREPATKVIEVAGHNEETENGLNVDLRGGDRSWSSSISVSDSVVSVSSSYTKYLSGSDLSDPSWIAVKNASSVSRASHTDARKASPSGARKRPMVCSTPNKDLDTFRRVLASDFNRIARIKFYAALKKEAGGGSEDGGGEGACESLSDISSILGSGSASPDSTRQLSEMNESRSKTRIFEDSSAESNTSFSAKFAKNSKQKFFSRPRPPTSGKRSSFKIDSVFKRWEDVQPGVLM